eukprot:3436505-Amphidinium_carterae.1
MPSAPTLSETDFKHVCNHESSPGKAAQGLVAFVLRQIQTKIKTTDITGDVSDFFPPKIGPFRLF